MLKEPDFSSSRFAKQFLFYHQDTAQIDLYTDTLRQAGLPE